MEERLRVLVIAYYFPPMGFSGVQRVLGLVRYLPELGWEPTVLTVTPRAYFALDEGLLERIPAEVTVVRTDSPDPLRWIRRGRAEVVPFSSERRRKWFTLASQLLFIPDNKRGWMSEALRAGRDLLRSGSFDVIFSSAPPYTAHLIAMKLSKEFDIPFVADFRDPWLKNPRHIYPTPYHRRRHEALERKVILEAHTVTTINRRIKESFLHHLPPNQAFQRIRILPHGYDPRDRLSDGLEAEDRLVFCYTGSFYHAQTPVPFLEGMRRLIEMHPEWKDRVALWFAGLMAPAYEEAIRSMPVETHLLGYRPYEEVVQLLRRCTIPWLTVGRQRGEEYLSLSKLGMYIGTRKPILGLVPGCAARDMLEGYGAAYIAPPDDPQAIAEVLSRVVEDREAGRWPLPDEAFVRRHSYRKLAETLVGYFREVLTPL